MLIIFGTKRMKAQNLGPVSDTICGNCNNPVAYQLYQQRQWFHIFWIPIIPISNKHFVLCPICSRGGEVSAAQLPSVTALVEARSQVASGQITPEDFAAQEAQLLAVLNQMPYNTPPGTQPLPPPPPPPPAGLTTTATDGSGYATPIAPPPSPPTPGPPPPPT